MICDSLVLYHATITSVLFLMQPAEFKRPQAEKGYIELSPSRKRKHDNESSGAHLKENKSSNLEVISMPLRT